MINSKQRAKLRSFAQTEPCILQIGKAGFGDAFIKQVADALKARELIKINVLENAPYDAKEASVLLANETDCEVVQVMGHKITLYKPNPEKNIIKL